MQQQQSFSQQSSQGNSQYQSPSSTARVQFAANPPTFHMPTSSRQSPSPASLDAATVFSATYDAIFSKLDQARMALNQATSAAEMADQLAIIRDLVETAGVLNTVQRQQQ